jgi:hypothetical protein
MFEQTDVMKVKLNALVLDIPVTGHQSVTLETFLITVSNCFP